MILFARSDRCEQMSRGITNVFALITPRLGRMVATMDRECAAIYRQAGLDPDGEPPAMGALARSILSAEPMFDRVDRILVRRVGGRWRVLVPAGATDADARFAVADTVAWWWLKRFSAGASRAPELASRLLCPHASFARCLDAIGEDVPELARRYGVGEPLALLRIGEVTGRPVVLQGDQIIRIRGDSARWHGLRSARRVSFSDDPRIGFVG